MAIMRYICRGTHDRTDWINLGRNATIFSRCSIITKYKRTGRAHYALNSCRCHNTFSCHRLEQPKNNGEFSLIDVLMSWKARLMGAKIILVLFCHFFTLGAHQTKKKKKKISSTWVEAHHNIFDVIHFTLKTLRKFMTLCLSFLLFSLSPVFLFFLNWAIDDTAKKKLDDFARLNTKKTQLFSLLCAAVHYEKQFHWTDCATGANDNEVTSYKQASIDPIFYFLLICATATLLF